MNYSVEIEELENKRNNSIIRFAPTTFIEKGKIRKLIGNLIRNSSLQLLFANLSERHYLNLGSGGNLIKDFINIDYSWRQGLDLCWDIRKKIPFKDNSFKGIFIEHVLEHFDWMEALNIVLPEAFRLLKPGGSIRISVPDAEEAVLKYYRSKQEGIVDTQFLEKYDGGLRIPLTPMLDLNNTFRRIYEPVNIGHKFAYDFQTLEYFLHTTGFINIKREVYLQGRDPALLMDYEKRKSESLYVEASKPL